MPGGCCIYHKTIVEPYLPIPVPFDDVVFIKPQRTSVVRPCPVRDDRAGFGFSFNIVFMIEVIPMIVRKKEIIDRRDFFRGIRIRTGITAGGEFQRRGASRLIRDQPVSFTIDLYEIR